MPSMKVILLLSAIMLTVYFVDNSAGNPYPSIGKGKTKRLGNCAFIFLIIFLYFRLCAQTEVYLMFEGS